MPQNLLHNLSCCDLACPSGTAQGDSQGGLSLDTKWETNFGHEQHFPGLTGNNFAGVR